METSSIGSDFTYSARPAPPPQESRLQEISQPQQAVVSPTGGATQPAAAPDPSAKLGQQLDVFA